MKFKELEFQQATCSNRDYQVNDEELETEVKSKTKKWKKAKDDLEKSISDNLPKNK
ncbi:hypothetical protein HOE04_02010 [archaeon]|jgi:hypothetical protein|nr:hypothetical protein [archaeon]